MLTDATTRPMCAAPGNQLTKTVARALLKERRRIGIAALPNIRFVSQVNLNIARKPMVETGFLGLKGCATI